MAEVTKWDRSLFQAWVIDSTDPFFEASCRIGKIANPESSLN
jgi:hypothetical protein